MFKPTRGGEEAVDVAVVAQILAPVLRAREKDGSSVLDLCGDPDARVCTDPDEILMVCVDISASMGLQTDFDEIVDETEEEDDSGMDSLYSEDDIDAESEMSDSPPEYHPDESHSDGTVSAEAGTFDEAKRKGTLRLDVCEAITKK